MNLNTLHIYKQFFHNQLEKNVNVYKNSSLSNVYIPDPNPNPPAQWSHPKFKNCAAFPSYGIKLKNEKTNSIMASSMVYVKCTYNVYNTYISIINNIYMYN